MQNLGWNSMASGGVTHHLLTPPCLPACTDGSNSEQFALQKITRKITTADLEHPCGPNINCPCKNTRIGSYIFPEDECVGFVCLNCWKEWLLEKFVPPDNEHERTIRTALEHLKCLPEESLPGTLEDPIDRDSIVTHQGKRYLSQIRNSLSEPELTQATKLTEEHLKNSLHVHTLKHETPTFTPRDSGYEDLTRSYEGKGHILQKSNSLSELEPTRAASIAEEHPKSATFTLQYAAPTSSTDDLIDHHSQFPYEGMRYMSPTSLSEQELTQEIILSEELNDSEDSVDCCSLAIHERMLRSSLIEPEVELRDCEDSADDYSPVTHEGMIGSRLIEPEVELRDCEDSADGYSPVTHEGITGSSLIEPEVELRDCEDSADGYSPVTHEGMTGSSLIEPEVELRDCEDSADGYSPVTHEGMIGSSLIELQLLTSKEEHPKSVTHTLCEAPTLKCGDHIVWNGHHAIVEDVNDTILTVIKFSMTYGQHCIMRSTLDATKELETLYHVRYSAYIRQYNPVELVIARARTLIGVKRIGLYSDNSENFAAFCKTGNNAIRQSKWLQNKLEEIGESIWPNALAAVFASHLKLKNTDMFGAEEIKNVSWFTRATGTAIIIAFESGICIWNLAQLFQKYKAVPEDGHLRLSKKDFIKEMVDQISQKFFAAGFGGGLTLAALGTVMCPSIGLVEGVVSGITTGCAASALGRATGATLGSFVSHAIVNSIMTNDHAVTIDELNPGDHIVLHGSIIHPRCHAIFIKNNKELRQIVVIRHTYENGVILDAVDYDGCDPLFKVTYPASRPTYSSIEILKRAIKAVAEYNPHKLNYNILWNNCKHFVYSITLMAPRKLPQARKLSQARELAQTRKVTQAKLSSPCPFDLEEKQKPMLESSRPHFDGLGLGSQSLALAFDSVLNPPARKVTQARKLTQARELALTRKLTQAKMSSLLDLKEQQKPVLEDVADLEATF